MTVTPEAVTAALQARDESQSMTDEGLTRDMLEAAAPLIAAAERERCAQIADHPDVARLVAETIEQGMIIRQGPPEIARSLLAGLAALLRDQP